MKKYLCFRCEHELCIDNNICGSNIGLATEDKRDSPEDFSVTLMNCPHCGMMYEVYDIPESERDNYDYFKE